MQLAANVLGTVSGLQVDINLLLGEVNHQQYKIQRLGREIEDIRKHKSLKHYCEDSDDARQHRDRHEVLQVGEQPVTQST